MNINNSNAYLGKYTYDAIVIGSGISGGWAAKELTQKGLKTLMLDRGRPLEHVTDYETATLDPWDFEHRGNLTNEEKAAHPYLRRDYPYSEATKSFWFNDLDAPYAEKKRFDWYRPNIVGGRSIMWGRHSYRWTDIDFEANLRDGIATDWPIRYADIAPWYDYAERFAGISGENLEDVETYPQGQLLPPMPLNIVERTVRDRVLRQFPNRHLVVGRVANLTQPHNGRGACQHRNLCSRGCPFGAYFSTQSATLPAAMATKRLTVRPYSLVTHIIYDETKGKATGVAVLDTETGEKHEYFAKIIFVNASAIWSTWILMNSTSSRFPNGLGNASGMLGKNLMDHHFRTGASGRMEGFDDKYYIGRRPSGIYMPRYRNLGNEKRDYIRGFGYQGGASRTGWTRLVAETAGFGTDFKNTVIEAGPWTMGLTGFGEILPYEENKMLLNLEVKDKYGLPTITFDAEIKDNEKKMRRDMANDAAEMLSAAGLKDIKTFDNGYHLAMGIHEMGTARMGSSKENSVLNGWNQVHECKNVFVTDGACMTSAACVNPSLTYMALTARAADYAVKQLKKRKL